MPDSRMWLRWWSDPTRIGSTLAELPSMVGVLTWRHATWARAVARRGVRVELPAWVERQRQAAASSRLHASATSALSSFATRTKRRFSRVR